MCRRCGESDGRGSAGRRRARRLWLLSPAALHGGDGEKVECWNFVECGTVLTFESMEVDRIIPGWQCYCSHAISDHAIRCTIVGCGCTQLRRGSYRRENIRPSCPPCNKGRWYGERIGRLMEEKRCRFG